MNVITIGTFDTPHYGHLNLLSYCKKIAGEGKVIVSVNTDEFIERFKGKRPVMSFSERMMFMSSIPGIDYSFPNFGEEMAEQTIDRVEQICDIKLDLIVIGSDWHSKDYLAQLHTSWDWLRENKMGVCYIPYTEGISSTELKRRLSVNSDNSNPTKGKQAGKRPKVDAGGVRPANSN